MEPKSEYRGKHGNLSLRRGNSPSLKQEPIINRISSSKNHNFHRDPLKSMLSEMTSCCNISREEGKLVISCMLNFVESKMWNGEDIDFGAFRLKQVKKSPIHITSKLKTAKGSYFIGERLKWKLTVSKGWENKTRPPWSNV